MASKTPNPPVPPPAKGKGAAAAASSDASSPAPSDAASPRAADDAEPPAASDAEPAAPAAASDAEDPGPSAGSDARRGPTLSQQLASPPPPDEADLAAWRRPRLTDLVEAPRKAGEPEPARAVVNETDENITARPDPSVHITLAGDVVIGNWFGHYKGKTASVRHGTPVNGLERGLVQLIYETPGARIGPVAPKGPDNPMTP
jgi:hypothetical protein